MKRFSAEKHEAQTNSRCGFATAVVCIKEEFYNFYRNANFVCYSWNEVRIHDGNTVNSRKATLCDSFRFNECNTYDVRKIDILVKGLVLVATSAIPMK